MELLNIVEASKFGLVSILLVGFNYEDAEEYNHTIGYASGNVEESNELDADNVEAVEVMANTIAVGSVAPVERLLWDYWGIEYPGGSLIDNSWYVEQFGH